MELILYEQEDGRCPFSDWVQRLRDRQAQSRILLRLQQVRAGNLGDYSSVGDGAMELRIHIGAGYRVYFGRSGAELVILLCGGDKDSQQKDIQRAKKLWADWKRRHNDQK